jgi:CheY-like chemotaxis protein
MRDRPLILVVEDDVDSYELYSDFLASAGYAVVGAGNGIEAVSCAKSSLPDLIVMDLALPGQNGLEAARRIRADERMRRVPIIALSGLVLDDYIEAARLAGCDLFLNKPCPLKWLLAEVRRLLSVAVVEGATGCG